MPTLFGPTFSSLAEALIFGNLIVTPGLAPAFALRVQCEKFGQDGPDHCGVVGHPDTPGNLLEIVRDGLLGGVVQIEQTPIGNVLLKCEVGSVGDVITNVKRVVEHFAP
jgi:hypothetical protein